MFTGSFPVFKKCGKSRHVEVEVVICQKVSCQLLEKLLRINTHGQEIPLPATQVWLAFQKGFFKRLILMF